MLVQAREDLIERTFESLVGARRVIIHLYNSTSPGTTPRGFRKSKEEILAIAVQGARWIRDRLGRLKGHRRPSPVFPGELQRNGGRIRQGNLRGGHGGLAAHPGAADDLNLPDTVEVAMPNVYADQIEWICRCSETGTPSS